MKVCMILFLSFLNDGDKMNDIGKRAHVMKNSHGRCVVGAFDKILYEVSIWTGNRAVLYFILHRSIFPHFVHNGHWQILEVIY